jgi:hypothetical protein
VVYVHVDNAAVDTRHAPVTVSFAANRAKMLPSVIAVSGMPVKFVPVSVGLAPLATD